MTLVCKAHSVYLMVSLRGMVQDDCEESEALKSQQKSTVRATGSLV